MTSVDCSPSDTSTLNHNWSSTCLVPFYQTIPRALDRDSQGSERAFPSDAILRLLKSLKMS